MTNLTLKERASRTAREMLAERIGALQTVRELLPLLHQDTSIVSSTDFDSMRGIDSETDDLPVGCERELWHPDSLAEKDLEIARCKSLYREHVRSICERILAE
jgi:hypothetical protein